MTATRGKGATKATRTEEASGEQLKSKSRLQGGVAKSKDAAKTPDRDAKKKKKGFLGGLFGKKGKKPKEKMNWGDPVFISKPNLKTWEICLVEVPVHG